MKKKFDMAFTFLVLPIYWIRSVFIRKWGSQTKKDKEMKMYPKHYLGFRGIKVEVVGDELDPNIPAVFVSNHQSMNDIFITIAAVNRPFRFIAKKELFKNFITGTFMKMTNSYPLDRDDARQSLLVLKQAVEDVKSGASVLAFPEGTRSHSKDMLEFKDGIFSMLKKSKAPIVPMYIKESFNESQKFFYVYMSKSLLYQDYSSLTGVELSGKVRVIMEELKAKAYM